MPQFSPWEKCVNAILQAAASPTLTSQKTRASSTLAAGTSRRGGEPDYRKVPAHSILQITFGDEIVLRSLYGSIRDWCSSECFVYNGQEQIMRLTGRHHAVLDPDVTLSRQAFTSYAMSNQVQPIDARPGQLLLLDYLKTVADVDGRGKDDDLDSFLEPPRQA